MFHLTSYELRKVAKPARYVGQEYNAILKDKRKIAIRYAMCFPDIYDVGMANLGMKIIYHLLNKREDTWCERVFAPWIDFEAVMRKKNILLYGLESKDPISTFDFVGFTLQYEMSYTNIVNMLDMASIPIFSKDRTESDPLIMAGGPCSCNPYPLLPFIDIFVMGEAEELLGNLMDVYRESKEKKETRAQYLQRIKEIKGIMVPSLHSANDRIEKVVVDDLEHVSYPVAPVVPNIEITQDKINLEVLRGCTRGCRFCQAGFLYRPVREKSVDKLVKLAKETIEATGQDEICLSSLSTSDYSGIVALSEKLKEVVQQKKMTISMPSLRMDSITPTLLTNFKMKKSGSFTFAPEAGSQRLRDVINKNLTEQEILSSCKLAFENGWSHLKLYFMIGLPSEDFNDLQAIVDLCHKILDEYYKVPKEKRKGKCRLTVSTSTFVPKPHTPFQWCAQDKLEKIEIKQQFLKEKLYMKNVTYSWHNPYISRLEAMLARGDEKIAQVIYLAWKNGCRFDSWEECLNKDGWEKALAVAGVKIQEYANQEYDLMHTFCYDHIFYGVDKRFLITEYEKSRQEITTNRCTESCSHCGIDKIAICQYRIKR